MPADRRFLAAIPIEQIFECVAILIQDPFSLWDLIKESWRPNFIEPAVLSHYADLFNENTDSHFNEALKRIED